MRFTHAARLATSLAITVGGIAAACRNDVPGPTLPTPVAPEVTRESPSPQPIDPSAAPRPDAAPSAFVTPSPQITRRVSAAYAERLTEDEPVVEPPTKEAPTDAGVTDVIDLPPVPDADVDVVRDAGQPLN